MMCQLRCLEWVLQRALFAPWLSWGWSPVRSPELRLLQRQVSTGEIGRGIVNWRSWKGFALELAHTCKPVKMSSLQTLIHVKGCTDKQMCFFDRFRVLKYSQMTKCADLILILWIFPQKKCGFFYYLFCFSLYDAIYVPVAKHIHNIPRKRQK